MSGWVRAWVWIESVDIRVHGWVVVRYRCVDAPGGMDKLVGRSVESKPLWPK